MLELAGEALLVGLGDVDRVCRSVALAAAVDGRGLLEPRRGERERAHGVGEEQRDRLAVLVRVQELDPGAIPACPAAEPDTAGHCAPLVPPVAADHLWREWLAHALQQAVDDPRP